MGMLKGLADRAIAYGEFLVEMGKIGIEGDSIAQLSNPAVLPDALFESKGEQLSAKAAGNMAGKDTV